MEHRLIPAIARSMTKDLRVNYGHASVWALACQDSTPGGHAGVGVVSLKGAPVTLPSFRTVEFGEYFRLAGPLESYFLWPVEVLLICLWFMGTMGASDDPHELALTNKHLEAVICEAKACGTGQPVIISGDLNAEPSVIPVNAKVLKFCHLIDLEGAYASGRGVPPSPTCRFALDGAPGTRRDFFFGMPQCSGCEYWLSGAF